MSESTSRSGEPDQFAAIAQALAAYELWCAPSNPCCREVYEAARLELTAARDRERVYRELVASVRGTCLERYATLIAVGRIIGYYESCHGTSIDDAPLARLEITKARDRERVYRELYRVCKILASEIGSPDLDNALAEVAKMGG